MNGSTPINKILCVCLCVFMCPPSCVCVCVGGVCSYISYIPLTALEQDKVNAFVQSAFCCLEKYDKLQWLGYIVLLITLILENYIKYIAEILNGIKN